VIEMTGQYKYEEAVAKLEQIIERLEKGDLTLEQTLEFFEEGVKLTKICSKILDEADAKIQVLTKDLNGDFYYKDFDGGQTKID